MKDVFTILLNLAKRIKTSFTRLTAVETDVSNLETWQSGVADYVVEQGMNGNWKWKKWKSGNYEAMHQIGVNPNGQTSALLFTDSDLNSRFRVTDTSPLNTVVTVGNGNANASSAHVEGTAHTTDGKWYVVFDRSVSGSIYVTVMINYFTS